MCEATAGRVYRDHFGIPHVRASNVLDVAALQGRVTATDRSWQLELLRRRAEGTCAEALGRQGLPWDVLVRRAGVARLARAATERLDPATSDFLASYVDGVNRGLHAESPEFDQLGISPSPWQLHTPIATFLAQHLLFAALPTKLWHHAARKVLGDEVTLLAREGATAGSNAWGVNGARTASGYPLLGGDPHRPIEWPGVYMQIRLACDDPSDRFDVAGFTFPGVPGVQHFAHAGEVAWGITHAMADYQDVFSEQLRMHGELVEAAGPDGWEPAERHREIIVVAGGAPHVIDVVRTRRGYVIDGEIEDGSAISLCSPALVTEDAGFGALLPLLRARSVADVCGAFDQWVEPVNNVVVADRSGALAYRVAGRVPVRGEANRRGVVPADELGSAWTGWLTLPQDHCPTSGQVVTANERRGPESARIGTVFEPPHRAARITDLLNGRDDLVALDFQSIHYDSTLPVLSEVRRLLQRSPTTKRGEAVRQRILNWDGQMDAQSRGAAAFAAWRSALVLRITGHPALRDLAANKPFSPVFAASSELVTRVGLAFNTLLVSERPFGIDLPLEAGRALNDVPEHTGTWGSTHVLKPMSPVPNDHLALEAPTIPLTQLSGDLDCVHCTASVPGVTDACSRGSVARYVWDLAARDNSGWVVPLGASGDPRSPHAQDQLELWANGRLAPIVSDWRLLDEVNL